MKVVSTLVCALALGGLVGCSHMTGPEQSALSGSAMGALGGAALGALTGQAGTGALMGAGLGAVAGSAIGEDRRRGEMQRYYEQRRYSQAPQAQRRNLVREYHHYYDANGNEVIEEEQYFD